MNMRIRTIRKIAENFIGKKTPADKALFPNLWLGKIFRGNFLREEPAGKQELLVQLARTEFSRINGCNILLFERREIAREP